MSTAAGNHGSLFRVVVPSAVALLWVVPAARAEPFIGQFELKTLESAPGTFEFQSQNAWSWGHPPRRMATTSDGVEFDENEAVRERHALELETGFSRTLKMRFGIEFEKERLDQPETIDQANDFDDLSLTELGAELIAVLAPREGDGVGFGVVAEVEGPLDQEDSNSLALGAIVEFRSGRWFVAAVPMFVHAFGGNADDAERIDDKWDFAYATQITYTLSESWLLALEGYGTIERLGRSGDPSQAAQVHGDFDQHRLGPVLYYTHDFGASAPSQRTSPESAFRSGVGEEAERATVSIGVGLLEGLNRHTADHTLKLSLEVDF